MRILVLTREKRRHRYFGNHSGKIKGAFTMGRTLKHEYDKLNKFWWIHRYDQADIFNKQAELKVKLNAL